MMIEEGQGEQPSSENQEPDEENGEGVTQPPADENTDITDPESNNDSQGNTGEVSPQKTPAPEKKAYSLLQEGDPWSPGSINNPQDDDKVSTVHVVARIRPFTEKEQKRGDKDVVTFPGPGKVNVMDNQNAEKKFAFHAIFEPGSHQADVFSYSGMEHLINQAMDGYACTAFAFGQTGSGKTYTMTGPATPEVSEKDAQVSVKELENYGLIQFSFAYIIANVFKKADTVFTIRASYLEIYNEQVQDLLNPTTAAHDACQVRWSKEEGFYVENLFVREIESLNDLLEVLEEGMSNRAVAAHNMNEHSSRSHSILSVYLDSVTPTEEGMSITKHGKLSFVDLAGSEKVKDTGSSGETLIEATNINRSLLTLGNCISALSDPKKRGGHIPFRDSKLTKLLADSLGGSGITLMIACVSPSVHSQSETLNTLRYAKRARKIKNKPTIRIDPREELILKLQRELKLVRNENNFLRQQLEFPRSHQQDEEGKQRTQSRRSQVTAILATRSAQRKRTGSSSSVKPQNGDGEQTADAIQRPVSENSLYEMLQEYMVENETLRNENATLVNQHSNDEREFGMIASENDKLTRKLDDLSRLMMASPWYSSSFATRTHSGRSSFTLTSSVNGSARGTPPYRASRNNSIDSASVFSDAASFQSMQIREAAAAKNVVLPPIKSFPKNVLIEKRLQRLKEQMEKPRNSASYTNTYYTKINQSKGNNANGDTVQTNVAPRRGSNRNLIPDFPFVGLNTKKREVRPEIDDVSNDVAPSESGYKTSSRTSYNSSPAKSVYSTSGQVLPQEAYVAQDISGRATVTKELSATSMRKLNNRMRQEMEALDAEINSYQNQIHQQPSGGKKKVPVT